MNTLMVLLGGACGAPLRYGLSVWIPRPRKYSLPWGTFAANILGTLILGLVVGAVLNGPMHALIGTGFCGALTTFSTFEKETFELLEAKKYATALTNAAGSLVVGLLAVAAGYAIGTSL